MNMLFLLILVVSAFAGVTKLEYPREEKKSIPQLAQDSPKAQIFTERVEGSTITTVTIFDVEIDTNPVTRLIE